MCADLSGVLSPGDAENQPPIRAIWLGTQLREMRESARLTVRDLGKKLHKGGSTVSRMELAQYPVSTEDVTAYVDMCGVTDPHRRTDLLTICRDVSQRGWWNGYSNDVAPTLMDIAWMESKATTIASFNATYFPGLLQVPGYAEALMRAKNPQTPSIDIERWVDMRMKRQLTLTQHNPVRFLSVIDEQMFANPVGDTNTWTLQLDHLLRATEHENVDLRILPAGTCTGFEGPFQVFNLVSPYPTVAYVATAAGDICVEGQAVQRLVSGYERLQEMSLDARASRKVIRAERDKL